ncbi:MAG TPA: glycoside hydrolase family 3 protein [Longimicrobium sp.]|nr:glycoside hydrolase family 3 protein [Longimicrobium sp.]
MGDDVRPERGRVSAGLRRARGWALLLALAATGAWGPAPPPDPAGLLRHDARARALLARMTLAEKIGQMTQADHAFIKDPADVQRYALGSVLNGGGSDPAAGNHLSAWRDLVEAYQGHAARTRLRIPLLHGIDAVHGNANVLGATVFPHNIGLGATRNPALVRRIGELTALETRAIGVNWAFAPCVCVPRDLRWGRTYEGFSEDPAIVAELGAAAVRGLQGRGLGDPRGVAATPKHFVADGGTRPGTGAGGGLDQGDARMDPATLRRIHLEPYRHAVAAGAATVMASFSSWNGIKVHGDRYLLTDVLKAELGFTGFVVSDWRAVNQVHPDFKTAISISINAGVDMVMVPEHYPEFIRLLTELANEGRVPMARIDDAVVRILRVKAAMGLLDPGYDGRADRRIEGWLGAPEHRAVARQAVRESMVLLKNAHRTLPLSRAARRIHVAGRNADDLGNQAGGWTIEWQGKSGEVMPGGTTILAAIRRAVSPGTQVTYAPDGAGAAGADAVIVVVGEAPYAEMEGDTMDLSLDPRDRAAVANARAAGVPVVVVVVSGRPLVLGQVQGQADALLAAWLPGTEGDGVADVLFGAYRPTGRLPYTWPASMQQVPVDSIRGTPLYPLGYGLTY